MHVAFLFRVPRVWNKTIIYGELEERWSKFEWQVLASALVLKMCILVQSQGKIVSCRLSIPFHILTIAYCPLTSPDSFRASERANEYYLLSTVLLMEARVNCTYQVFTFPSR